jgi:hypothetical protein
MEGRCLVMVVEVFFDSSDSLVAQHINGFEDVYEYEPTWCCIG